MLYPHMHHVQGMSSQTFQTSDFPRKEEEVSSYFINGKTERWLKANPCPLDRRSKAAPEIWSHSYWNKHWAHATAW